MSSGDPVTVTFQVSMVWKGPEENTLIVRTVLTDASCGYEFQKGQEYLVYAYGTANLHVSLCSRTQLLSAASEDLKALGEGKAQAVPARDPDVMQADEDLKALGEGKAPITENANEPEDTQLFMPVVLLGLIGAGTLVILIAIIRKLLSQKA